MAEWNAHDTGSTLPGAVERQLRVWRNVTGTDVNAVNIYNPADIVNSFALGFVRGATNYSQTVGQQAQAGDPEGIRIHSHKNHLAEQVLRVDLRVQFDQRGDYRVP